MGDLARARPRGELGLANSGTSYTLARLCETAIFRSSMAFRINPQSDAVPFHPQIARLYIVATIVYVSTIVFIASIVVILIAVVGVVPISVIIAVVSVASCTPFTGLLGQGFSDGYS